MRPAIGVEYPSFAGREVEKRSPPTPHRLGGVIDVEIAKTARLTRTRSDLVTVRRSRGKRREPKGSQTVPKLCLIASFPALSEEFLTEAPAPEPDRCAAARTHRLDRCRTRTSRGRIATDQSQDLR